MSDRLNQIRARMDAGARMSDVRWLVAEVDRLAAENTQLLDLVADFVDGEECRLDARGYCETHSWFYAMPCPHGRAKEMFKEAPDA